MLKSLDGIRKISGDDLKKSREIVLNYIKEQGGDSVASEVAKTRRVNSGRGQPVDGVMGKKRIERRSELTKNGQVKEILALQEKLEKRKQEEEKERQENLKRQAIKKQEELKKRALAEASLLKLKKAEDEKKKAEEKRLELEKIRQEEERKKEKEMKKEEERKSKELEKKRKQEEKERRKQEKRRLKEERKIKEELARREKLEQEQRKREDEIKRKDEDQRKKDEEKRRIEEKNERMRMEKMKERQEKERIIEQAKKEEQERKEKQRLEKIRLEEEKRMGEELIRKQKIEEEQKNKGEEIKRKEEEKRIKEEEKKRREEEKERKKLRRARRMKIRRKKLRKDFFSLLDRLNKPFLDVIKVFSYTLPILFFTLIFGYFFLLLILLNLGIDNNVTRGVAKYVSLPVLITKMGMVEYYDFKDTMSLIEDSYEDSYQKDINVLKDKTKEKLISNLTINSLAKKYNVRVYNEEIEVEYAKVANAGNKTKREIYTKVVTIPEILKRKLALKIVSDKEINRIGLARIESIYNLFKTGKDFDEIRKYSDESISELSMNSEEILAKFGQSLDGLAVGEVSNTISTAQGYFIVQKYEQKDNIAGLRYIFVRARNFDDYIDEKLKEIKVLSMID